MPAGAGADSSVRRWRVSLTLVAWMLLVQAAVGVATAPLTWISLRLADPSGLSGISALPPVAGGSSAVLAGAFSRVGAVTWLSLVFNLLLLAGSIGLLKRWKWGWFTVIGVHLAAIVVSFVWGLPMLQALLAVFAPADADLAALVIIFLFALIPASVIGFLMVNGVVRQFDAGNTDSAAPDG